MAKKKNTTTSALADTPAQAGTTAVEVTSPAPPPADPAIITAALLGVTYPEDIRLSELWIDQAQNMRVGGSTPDAITRMRESLRMHGQVQRIVVMPTYSAPEGSTRPYQVVVGYTRAEAMLAEFGEDAVIKVEVAPELTPESARTISAIENMKREDLGPLQEARMYERMMKADNMRQADVARRLGIDRAIVSNRMKLLDPRVVSDEALAAAVDAGTVPARVLLSVLALKDEKRRDKLIGGMLEGTLSGGMVQTQIAQWALAEKESKADNPPGGTPNPDNPPKQDKPTRGSNAASPLNMKEARAYFAGLQPQPDAEGNDPPPEAWDAAACIGYLVIKALDGKLSAAKFRTQSTKLVETGTVDN